MLIQLFYVFVAGGCTCFSTAQRGHVRVAWTASGPAGEVYLALFNTGDLRELQIEVPLADLGITAAARVRDLWAQQDIGDASGDIRDIVAPHAAKLYKLTQNT